MSDILICKFAEVLSSFMSNGIENKLGVTHLHIPCKWELISYLWSYISSMYFVASFTRWWWTGILICQSRNSANTVFAFIKVALQSPYLKVQTLLRNVKPTLDQISVSVEGNSVVLAIMFTLLEGSERKINCVAERDQVHTYQVMKNCWHWC